MAKTQKKVIKKVDKSSDIPASQGQLEALRAEMKSEFASQKLESKAMEKRLESKISTLDSKISGHDAKFASLESKIEALTAVCHRTLAIVEEQNARNQFLFDGYKGVISVQESQQDRIKKLEKATFGIES